MTQPDEAEMAYADFLSSLFGVMAKASPRRMREYAAATKAINPDLARLIEAFSNYSSEYISSVRVQEGRTAPTNGRVFDVSVAFTHEFDLLFRSRKLFKTNEDLMAFLSTRYGMHFGNSSYSRTSIIRMFEKRARDLESQEIEELVKGLRVLMNPGKTDATSAFYRQWSNLIRRG